MKGKKCFGVLLALSIIFGLSLNVYLDVNATSYSVSLDYINTLDSPTWTTQVRLGSGEWSTISRGGYLPEDVDPLTKYSRYVGSLTTGSSYDIVKDHIYQVKVQVFTTSDTINPINMLNEFHRSNYFSLIDASVDIESTDTQPVKNNCLYGARSDSSIGTSPSIYACNSFLYPSQSKLYTFLLKARTSGNFPIKVGADNSYTFTFEHEINTRNERIYIIPYQDIVEYEYSDFARAVEEMNDKDNEDRDNLESQSSSTESSAESSSQDAENTGTTLLGAFSSFVTALTSASPSNCKLDMDLGNLDLGIVDLCRLSLPQPFPTIASIMLILFCVPLSIATARKVINLFRSFQ